MNIKICLFGATGRMGHEVVASALRLAQTGEKVEVTIGVVEPGNVSIGKTIQGIKLPIVTDASKDIAQCNVIVDFSTPEGAHQALALAAEHHIPVLICTSGLGPEVESSIAQAKTETLVIRASNTSVGVNVMMRLVKEAVLALGEGFDIEISEIHHNMKRDAPSGTALALAQAIVDSRGNISLEDNLITGRFGITGKRNPNELGLFSIRGGDVAGEHTVYFLGAGERLEITHRASTPRNFADGALRAAQWLVQAKEAHKPNGLYTMSDVLGL